jgi:putative membrane protein
MVFVDSLSLELFTLALVGALIDYVVIGMYKDYRAKYVKKSAPKINVESRLEDSVFILGSITLFILVMGFYGEMTWNLPGAYNLLFYDPYIMLGIILLGLVMSVKHKHKLQYVGLIALFTGFILVEYGIAGYNLHYTQSPLDLLGLYLSFGLAGIFAYPMTLIIDKYRANGGNKPLPGKWIVWIILFLIFMTLGVGLAAFTGATSILSHLAVPP